VLHFLTYLHEKSSTSAAGNRSNKAELNVTIAGWKTMRAEVSLLLSFAALTPWELVGLQGTHVPYLLDSEPHRVFKAVIVKNVKESQDLFL
jgi:hypothetical protein